MQTAGASTAAVLTGGPTVGGTLAALQAVTAGGFNISINGLVTEIGPVDFSGAASLAACATLLNTAMSTCTVSYSGTAFVITSHALGPTATLSYATAPSGPTTETNVSATCLLTAGTAASLVQGSQGALGAQWAPANGAFYSGYAPRPARAHTAPSTGTFRDYWRRNMGFARTRGIGGFMLGTPYDPSAAYFVSMADDSSETTLVNPFTVQKPPPGVK